MILFKYPSLQPELNKLDHRLQTILFALSGFAKYHFNKDITLTELFRTQAQQDEYYKDDPAYQKSKFLSVHQVGRGADIRCDFTDDELQQITTFLSRFVYTGGKPTILIHDIGLGKHIHIQVDGDGRTELTA